MLGQAEVKGKRGVNLLNTLLIILANQVSMEYFTLGKMGEQLLKGTGLVYEVKSKTCPSNSHFKDLKSL